LRKVFGLLFFLLCFAWAIIAINADKSSEPDKGLAFVIDNLARVQTFCEARPALAMLGFAAVIFGSGVIGLPPPGVITMAGAALFGFLPAALISLPTTIFGAMFPFYLSRSVIGPLIKKKFPTQLAAMQKGLDEDGAWYLFSLRLVPLVPFPIVNLVMGLTIMPAKIFAGVSFAGRIPLTLLYSQAGMQLGSIRSTADIFTPQVIGSLLAVAVLPHIARALLNLRKRRLAV
jgi:uncharacterized membrane protein YdjX (TVP38/TMEM64 family)